MQIINGKLEGAQWLPSPNFGQRPDGGAGEVSLLVIHNISLPPGQYGGGYIQRFFQNQLPAAEHPYFAEISDLRVSSHLLIERSGHVVQFVNFNDRAWHAGLSCFDGRDNCNDFSIGIELEGCDQQAYSDAQYRQLSHITRLLIKGYPQLDSGRICGHEDIAPGRKTDPGPAFDWPRYQQLIQQPDCTEESV